MRLGHPQICLYRPQIPQNTGAIARLVAATCCRLHLITPLGFNLSVRELRRPGLDYWPFVDLEIHDDFRGFLQKHEGRVAFLTKFAKRPYTEIPLSTDILIFGQETSGLPGFIHEEFADSCYGIPMFHPGVRSLNLANAASIVLYDQLAKRGTFVAE